ncbi:protein EE13 [Elephant endotheliotropic herpesvirus 1A]|nr:protein EE13 [Elephant endotheliotropic herpesvirus 1A]
MRRFWGSRSNGGDTKKAIKKGVAASSGRINNILFGHRNHHNHRPRTEEPYEEIHFPRSLRYNRRASPFTYPNTTEVCSLPRCTYRRPASIPPISEIFDTTGFGGRGCHRHHTATTIDTHDFLNSSFDDGGIGPGRENRGLRQSAAVRQPLREAGTRGDPPSPPISISTIYQPKHHQPVPIPCGSNSDPPRSPLELPSTASSLLSREVENFMQQRPLPPLPSHPFFVPPLPTKQKSLPRSGDGNKKVVLERKKSDKGRDNNGGRIGAAAASTAPLSVGTNENRISPNGGATDSNEPGADGAAAASPCSPSATVVSVKNRPRPSRHEPRPLTCDILEFIGENLDQCGIFRNKYNRSEYTLPNSENARLVVADLRCDRYFFDEVLIAAFHLKDLLVDVEEDGVLFLGFIKSADFFNKAKVFILQNSGCLYLYRDQAFFKVANSLGDFARHGLLDVVVYTASCSLTDTDVSTLLNDENIRKALKSWVFSCDQKMIATAVGPTAEVNGNNGMSNRRGAAPRCCRRKNCGTTGGSGARDAGIRRGLSETEYRTRFLYGPLVSQANTKDMRCVTPLYLSGFISYVLKDLKRRAQSEKSWNETQHVGRAAEDMYERVREHLLTEVKRSLPELDLAMLKRQLDSLTGDCRCDYRVSTPYQHLRHILTTLAYVVYWTCYSNGGTCMSYSVYLSVRSLVALERLVFAELTWSKLKTAKKTSSGSGHHDRVQKHHHRPPKSTADLYVPPAPEPCCTSKSKKILKTAPCQFNVSTAMATLELTDDDDNRISPGNNGHYYSDCDTEKYVCVLNDSYEL